MITFQDLIGNTMTDHTTAGIAAGAVVSPIWLPFVQDASNAAALIAPLLGTIWLIIQIAGKLLDIRDKLKEKAREDRH